MKPVNFPERKRKRQIVALDNLLKASAFIIGSPDYFEYPSGWLKVFFDEMYNHRNELRDIPVFGFISHGGGDEETVRKHLRNLFDWMGFYPGDPCEGFMPWTCLILDNLRKVKGSPPGRVT